MTDRNGRPGKNMVPSQTQLGNFIRERRMARNLTQTALARLCGCSPTKISFAETRIQYTIPESLMEKLAEVLQCSMDDLRSREGVEIKMPRDTPTGLGILIRARREVCGLSQQEVATLVGVSIDDVIRWEERSLSLRQNVSARLAEVLQLEPGALARFVRKAPAAPKTGSLGTLIRTRRRGLAMSTVELAQLLGVSHQYVCQIESGRVKLSESYAMIARLAEILQVNPRELEAARSDTGVRIKASRMTTIGQLVTEQRLRRGFSQRQLAELLGVSERIIRKIETRGELPDDIEIVAKIQGVLGCSFSPELVAETAQMLGA